MEPIRKQIMGSSQAVPLFARPADPTHSWKAVELPQGTNSPQNEMVRSSGVVPYLVVIPLTMCGNVSGEGKGVNIIAQNSLKDINANGQCFRLTKHASYP